MKHRILSAQTVAQAFKRQDLGSTAKGTRQIVVDLIRYKAGHVF
jgi:hypothetical protein